MAAYSGPVLWHVRRGDRVHGPFEDIEIAWHAREGTLRGGDLLWCQGMPAWVAADRVPGLLAQRPPAPTASLRPQRAVPTQREALPAPVPGRQTMPGRYAGTLPRSPQPHAAPLAAPGSGVRPAAASLEPRYDAHKPAPPTTTRHAATRPVETTPQARVSPPTAAANMDHIASMLGAALVAPVAAPRAAVTAPAHAMPPPPAPVAPLSPVATDAAEPGTSIGAQAAALAQGALARARTLLEQSGGRVAELAGRLGDGLNVAALREHVHGFNFDEAFDKGLRYAISRVAARTLRELFSDDRVPDLADMVLDTLPPMTRYAIRLTVGKPAIERMIKGVGHRSLANLRPELLDAPLEQTAVQLVGSEALRVHMRSLSDGLRADVSAALGRLTQNRAAGAAGPVPAGA